MPTPEPATDYRQAIELEIRCPVQPRVLGLIRNFATVVAGQMGFSEEEVGQIEMAVDEACANVVRHAYKHLGISSDEEDSRREAPPLPQNTDGEEGCILKVRVALGSDALRFQIMDNGIGMNRRPAGVGSVEEYLERGARGGLGVYIIKNFMDEVEYEFPPGRGTVLTMTKYLRAPQSA